MLNLILKPEQSTTVLLETMAGKGSEVGREFEELREILDRVELKDKMGVCLDTRHVWDGGYDIVGDLDGVLNHFDDVIGLGRLRAIHLNDSMNPLGALKDRHAKIGEGHIGLEAMVRIINHPALRELPFYLETPNDLDGYAREIALLKSKVQGITVTVHLSELLRITMTEAGACRRNSAGTGGIGMGIIRAAKRSIGNIPGRSVAGGYRGGGYERPHGLYEGRKDKKRAE